ncbi:MAG: plasmid stabilization protein, partial [Mesorhizobium sp.]
MGTITVRNLADDVKQRLRERAAARGVSMEEEAREILGRSVLSAGVATAPEGESL